MFLAYLLIELPKKTKNNDRETDDTANRTNAQYCVSWTLGEGVL
jgi:hypothetical protein